VTLAGNGVLNMEGNSIGPVSAVQLAPNSSDNATLKNLGGAGVNGAGLTMSGLGDADAARKQHLLGRNIRDLRQISCRR